MSHTTLVAVLGQAVADSGDDASRRLSWIILALVVLAVVISVATVVFWRLTRPDGRHVEPAVRWVPATETDAPAAPPAASVPPVTRPGPADGPGPAG